MNELVKKDLKYLWHPYTQMKDCERVPPVLIEKAEGVKLFDVDGNFYYDTISSWWCNVHGHCHPEIKKAVRRQLDSLEHVLFAGFTHSPAIELAERLVSISPNSLEKVFYSDNGSTAVEVALKMSFQYWQNKGVTGKRKFLALDLAYHGDTIGAMSVSGVDLYNERFSPLFYDSYKVPSPYCYRCPAGKEKGACSLECLGFMEERLKESAGEISAVIMEPILMGAGGMIIYPADYLAGARALADKYGVHLILDEVASGFGRTGKMFASEHASVEPDIMCVSKGITSGYLPLSATLVTDDIYRAFYDDYEKKKTFYHGHTYTANPLACAAAVKAIDLFREEDTLRNVRMIEQRLGSFLEKMSGYEIVGDVRGVGAVGALELVKARSSKEPFGIKERIGVEVYKKGLESNLLLRPLGNIVYFFLPLCAKTEELDDIFRRSEKVIERVSGSGEF
ncbi:MAG: adenosylmethionine--8-amino-7-oxononanoate transaminase [Candidatus Omnitrophica bacterium]|nr:adenosylmethionine--8-amino-7-oxononanoate transaminase [Candidatus Omnitrophota bacterium]